MSETFLFEAEPLFPCPDVGEPFAGAARFESTARDMLRHDLVGKYRLSHPVAERIAKAAGPEWTPFDESMVRVRMVRSP